MGRHIPPPIEKKVSMLPTTLNTNEVKDSAGAEVEFTRLSTSERALVFAKVGESPAYPVRLKVSHEEVGDGTNKRRRSLVRLDYNLAGQVDTVKASRISVYAVADIPIGNLTALTVPATAMAHLTSFLASRGASTTILYDGTGCGAEALINGSL